MKKVNRCIPFIDAQETPLLLRMTCRTFFIVLFSVVFEVDFMLVLLKGTCRVTVTGVCRTESWSAVGDGVLMRDTENRPCTVGVGLADGKLTGVIPVLGV